MAEEEHLLRAVDEARGMSTKSLELRGTVSLARLWQQQDRVSEARKELDEVYGWFTEGFDTIDLQQANTLLNQLS